MPDDFTHHEESAGAQWIEFKFEEVEKMEERK
jgi:hypothetical protein